MNDRRAAVSAAPVVALALRAQARRWAEELYNQMSDLMREALEDISHTQGVGMCQMVLRELEALELEASIASGAGPS